MADPESKISVVIPVWRDSAELGKVLAGLRAAPEVGEVIVAVAEPDPGTQETATRGGARFVDAGPPNRGRQLDLGAAEASGAWLLFHHVDTALLPEHLRAIAALQDAPEVVGGAFYRKFDDRHPHLRRFEGVERWHNRTFGALYGDQSIFVRREVFQTLGGFRNLPLMEDVDFSLRLRAAGTVRLLDPPIASSPRRHLKNGPWRTTLLNAWLLGLYHCGVHPARLHRRYYRRSVASGAQAATQACLAPGVIPL